MANREVWVNVFRHLGFEDRARAATTCKAARAALQEPSLWRRLDLSGRQDAATVLSCRPFLDWLLPHYRAGVGGALQEINFEFAAGVEDGHLEVLAREGGEPGECLRDLRTLNLNACQKITDVGLKAVLPHCRRLQTLSLYWDVALSDATLFLAAAFVTGLQSLNLSGCQHVTDAGVAAVAGCCSGITHLDLTRCVRVTDAGFAAAARGCPGLQTLLLYADTAITDASLQAFASLKALRELDLCGARLITDEGLTAMAAGGGCGALTRLNLTWCLQVGDSGVVAVAHASPQLRELSLHGNTRVTDEVVDALAQGSGGGLVALDLSGCTGVARRRPEQLREKLPGLTCFKMHS